MTVTYFWCALAFAAGARAHSLRCFLRKTTRQTQAEPNQMINIDRHFHSENNSDEIMKPVWAVLSHTQLTISSFQVAI